jgi:tRNA1Val (adenine37-N6)-methyltransferase
MSNPYFSFKQFTVRHDRCAMKVGTDGVLLGAWTDVTGVRRLLDVGTGTGLIALMLAQRNAVAQIDAIDIDGDAVAQARENVLASPWSERIRVMEGDVCLYEGRAAYDLIVSNPPYFNALKCPDAQRHAARHTDSLSFRGLTAAASRLLTAEGRLAVVIPTDAVKDFLAAAAEADLFPIRRLQVATKPGALAKRTLMELARRVRAHEADTLVLEDAPGVRSAGYKALTAEFYIK